MAGTKKRKTCYFVEGQNLVNNIPFDLHYYERNYPLEPEKTENKENEKSKFSRDEWSKIKEELSKLKDSIDGLRPDNNKDNETKSDRNQTTMTDEQTAKKHKQETKRISKIDDNWTLARTRQPGSLERQDINPGTRNLSIKPTYIATAEPTHITQEQRNSRPRSNERPRSPRVRNYDEHSRGRYYLRNRHYFLPPQTANNSPYPN